MGEKVSNIRLLLVGQIRGKPEALLTIKGIQIILRLNQIFGIVIRHVTALDFFRHRPTRVSLEASIVKFCHSAHEEYVTNAKLEVIPAITSRDYQAKLKMLTS